MNKWDFLFSLFIVACIIFSLIFVNVFIEAKNRREPFLSDAKRICSDLNAIGSSIRLVDDRIIIACLMDRTSRYEYFELIDENWVEIEW